MARNASLLTLINMFEAAPCAGSAGSASGLSESAAVAALKGKGNGKGKSAPPNCPSDGQFVYNTDLLFDDRGALVAKYRKAHPAFIFSVDAPPRAETVTYTAKFNVTSETQRATLSPRKRLLSPAMPQPALRSTLCAQSRFAGR